MIPMVVRGNLVYAVVENLQASIASHFDDDRLGSLFTENGTVRLERERLVASIASLQEANQKLKSIN